MTAKAKQAILSALDGLALALCESGHAWSIAERRQYETAVRLLST